MNHYLIACIDSVKKGTIHARFFHIDGGKGAISDVTKELCSLIDEYNEQAKVGERHGQYVMKIPYTYKNNLATYSYGCGWTHYLLDNMLPNIAFANDNRASFPIERCRITSLTKDDIFNLLNVKSVFHKDIEEGLLKYYA